MVESICKGGKLDGTEFATSTKNKFVRAMKCGHYLNGNYYRTDRIDKETGRLIWQWVKDK